MLNITEFSESQQKAIAKLLQGYVESLGNPSGDDLLVAVKRKLFAPLATACDSLTVVELDNCEDTVVQRSVILNKVYEVLTGDFGLLRGFPLLVPLKVGVVEESGQRVLEGGRHRTLAIKTLFGFLGATPEQVNDIRIPVQVLPHDPMRILADNKSRGATTHEKTGVILSHSGINITSVEELISAYVCGKLPGTAIKQSGDFARVYLPLKTGEADVSQDTLARVGASILSGFKNHFPKNKKATADLEFNVRLLDFCAQRVPEALKFVKENLGITNVAYEYKTLADRLLTMAVKAVAAKELLLPEVKLIKTVTQAVEEKKEAKPSTPKQASSATRAGKGKGKKAAEAAPEPVTVE